MRSNRCLLGLLLPLFLLALSACNNSTQQVALPSVSARSSLGKSLKSQRTLVATDDMRKASAYKDIKGNIPRLKAMLSGQFVQYNTERDSLHKTYLTWLVNGGKDSVLVYTFPVGEPNRHGHWLYVQQVMTSLPESPLYTAFVKMEEINRDSILATYYEEPEDFAYTLGQMLQDPIGLFKEFKFEELKLSNTGEMVCYERETPLKFIGRSQMMDTESTQPKRLNGFDRDYYIVEPGLYHFGREAHDKNKKFLGRTQGERLIKRMMLSKDHLGR